jgi:hypothetical protein
MPQPNGKVSQEIKLKFVSSGGDAPSSGIPDQRPTARPHRVFPRTTSLALQQETTMKKTIATTVAALAFAAVSFGGAVSPAAAATTIVVHHPAHWHMHRVCKISHHNHHTVKVCTWVRNK